MPVSAKQHLQNFSKTEMDHFRVTKILVNVSSQCNATRRDGKQCLNQHIHDNGRCEYHQGLDFYLQSRNQEQCHALTVNGTPCQIIGVEEDGYCCFHQAKRFKGNSFVMIGQKVQELTKKIGQIQIDHDLLDNAHSPVSTGNVSNGGDSSPWISLSELYVDDDSDDDNWADYRQWVESH